MQLQAGATAQESKAVHSWPSLEHGAKVLVNVGEWLAWARRGAVVVCGGLLVSVESCVGTGHQGESGKG